jgi:hypothetical protein
MVENKVDPIRNSEINHITSFDEDFWINKATILKKLIDDSTLRESILGENKESHFLLYEIFSTKLHCCETLLRLLIIAKKKHFYPLLPLIRLKFPKFQKEFEFMKENSKKYFDTEFFKSNFYPFKELDSEQVEKSISFLENSIKYIIKEYDDHMANNVFKHGFYGRTTTNVSLSIENKPIGTSPNMIEWFEIDQFKDHHKLHHHSKSISVEREFNVIKICSSIIKQFFKIKRGVIKKEKSITMSFFNDVPLGKIFSVYQEGITIGQLHFEYEVQLPKDFP